eukprot:CAMPEP_0172388534 /NCGR_PEP_ID=MMETSP1061-20121228/5613_1 /TAXON_ID=37318 /ORGANISM="Pseudo-nitzschia pungens, Strain cf. pungens" /LENGTH=377 /DNA_ID=CAMNT_0013118449 /DNA_START=44 /DNA_END=1177 /DNA_ORIENTATION=+
MMDDPQNSTYKKLEDARKSIPELIEEGKWDVVSDWYEAHPEEIRGRVDPSNGSTILHAICNIPSAPVSLLQCVVDTWPEALTIQENKYGATPLHLLCWRVQRSPGKVKPLLERMKPEDLLIRNRVLGSTVLHSACGSHADISVIKAIIRKHPPVLRAKTFDQQTALHALWQSHLQSIPIHLEIARILRGKTVTENLFARFWNKVIFLATESFKLSSACPNDLGKGEEHLSKYILHGLLDMKGPLNALLVALNLNPKLASYADLSGNYPLHHAIARRPFRVKYADLLRELLKAYPEAAVKRNADGDAPIHIAIRDRIAWEDGLGRIIEAECNVLGMRDQQTGLYPFLMSASIGGNVAIETTFRLLIAKPDLVKGACSG